MLKSILLFISLTFFGTAIFNQVQDVSVKPKISFTFDDGSTKDMPAHKLETWNQMVLNALEKHKTKAVFFVNGSKLRGEKGEYVLDSWDKQGHKIANHSYSHFYFNSGKISLAAFQQDFLKNDSIIRKYANFYPYFRFPYLKEGNTEKKIEGFRTFLKQQNYKNGLVSIDASDWYINERLLQRLEENPKADLTAFKQFYLDHLYERALYYDSLAGIFVAGKMKHTLLLHHNLAAALFLDELIQHFKDKGWEIVDAEAAYKEEIYNYQSKSNPAGESVLWSIAKDSGKCDSLLRYPAEDSSYEKTKMDALGL